MLRKETFTTFYTQILIFNALKQLPQTQEDLTPSLLLQHEDFAPQRGTRESHVKIVLTPEEIKGVEEVGVEYDSKENDLLFFRK
jgi:hypothetical protein